MSLSTCFLYKSKSSLNNEFSVNSQQFYLINLVIFAVLLLYFLLGRSKSKHQPANLDMKAESNVDSRSKNVAHSKLSDEQAVDSARNVSKYEKLAEVTPKFLLASNKQVAAIFFVYNGHEWEAYEVLGLPKGSAIETVTVHYQHLIKTSDPSTFEFYEAAYLAILKA